MSAASVFVEGAVAGRGGGGGMRGEGRGDGRQSTGNC